MSTQLSKLAVGQNHQPILLEKLKSWVAERNSLLLEYQIGTLGGYALAVSASGEPQLSKIEISHLWAAALGVAAGVLTQQRFTDILANQDKTGVMGRLCLANTPAKAIRLQLLELLISERHREKIKNGSYQRLHLIIDGLLSMLPFDVLIDEADDAAPQYLLNVGPRVQYAPSATILINLSEYSISENESEVLGGQPQLCCPGVRSSSTFFTRAFVK